MVFRFSMSWSKQESQLRAANERIQVLEQKEADDEKDTGERGIGNTAPQKHAGKWAGSAI